MNKVSVLFAMMVAGALVGIPTSVRADLEVSASVRIHAVADFNAPLSSCGTWVEVGSYGRCWRPAGIAVGWRPYCNGEWVWTDCGWYWESDEPWAWACYHYGYWVYDSVYGWIWVPGVKWAPAWVCWRMGGGFIGWAPMPPPGFFFAHHPRDAAFVFVDDDRFAGHIRPSVVVTDNHLAIERTKFIPGDREVTRDIGGIGSRRVYVNDGPGLDAIQKATGRKFHAVSISTAVHRTPLPGNFRHEAVPGKINRESKSFEAPASGQPPGERQNMRPHAGPQPNRVMPYDKGQPAHYNSMPAPKYAPDKGGGKGGGNHDDHGHDHNSDHGH